MDFTLCKTSIALLIVLVAVNIYSSNASQGNGCKGKLDIVFVIDESSSIWPVHFVKLRQFIANLTDSFEIGVEHTRIAAITFSDQVTYRFSLSDYDNKEDVRKAVIKIDQKTGGTRTDLALKYVRDNMLGEKRIGVPQIVVLITDGASWYKEKTIHQAELLKSRNVTLFTIGISNRINWDEIISISSKPVSDHIFNVQSFNDLGASLADSIVNKTCLPADQSEECDGKLVDVVFVLGSMSQNPAGASQALTMVQNIVSDNRTFIGSSFMKFGIVPKCNWDFGFHLNTFDNKTGILNHLERTRAPPTTSDHLNYLVTNSFTAANGDRETARNLAVVIMDKRSPDFNETIAAAQRAKNAKIEIIAVSVGKDVNDEEISKIASDPISGHKVTLSNYSEVDELKNKLFSNICS